MGRTALSNACYYSAHNRTIPTSITNAFIVPCEQPTEANPFVNCCAQGNVCLSNGLCQAETFYISPCNDPSYKAPNCHKYCENRSDKYQLDVRYNATDNLWHCCRPGGPATCHGVSDEVFHAPKPSQLRVIASLPAQFQPTSTAAPRTGGGGGSSGGLNQGGIVGIVFGIIGLIVTTATLYPAIRTYLLKRRKLAEERKRIEELNEAGAQGAGQSVAQPEQSSARPAGSSKPSSSSAASENQDIQFITVLNYKDFDEEK